jgi:hypothetical protein
MAAMVSACGAPALGGDFAGYRNHAYRVMNLCLALSPSGDRRKIALAAAFHDLGIWTAATFDYIPPSVELASAHLAASSRSPWAPEIETTIREHHKLTRFRPHPTGWLNPSGRPTSSTCHAASSHSGCRARSSRMSSRNGPAPAFTNVSSSSR